MIEVFIGDIWNLDVVFFNKWVGFNEILGCMKIKCINFILVLLYWVYFNNIKSKNMCNKEYKIII